MKTAFALTAVLLLALSAAARADDGGTPVNSEAGSVVDSQGSTVISGKY